MEIAGYFASLLIGISLGLIGGGGSILTVPVLVYLFGLQPLVATSYSLFVVGSTSLIGAVDNLRKGLVNVKAALLFGSASISTVFTTRKFIIPLIANKQITVGKVDITESVLTMVLFAVLMLLASVGMIRRKRMQSDLPEHKRPRHLLKLVVYGIAIGIITGLLGAGGGFLLIPALVFLLKMPIKKAIGTSLLIIALNSLIGFTGDLGHLSIDWLFLLKISTIAITGVILGGIMGKKLPGEKLKKGFGWFVLVMGTYILFKEIFKMEF